MMNNDVSTTFCRPGWIVTVLKQTFCLNASLNCITSHMVITFVPKTTARLEARRKHRKAILSNET